MGIIVTGSRHSIRPSLNLDFANSKVLDPRITFTRGSNATYYDGYTSVKAEENLNTNSEDLISNWTRLSVTATANSTTAPDGTTTAELYEISNTTGQIYSFRDFTNSTLGYFTFSFFVKNDGAGYVILRIGDQGSPPNRYLVLFDLSTGTAVDTATNGSPQNVSNSITDVGNGWYRVSATYEKTVTSDLRPAIAPYATNTITHSSGTPSNTGGSVGDGVYVWGAQLEQRDSLTAYTPTTTSPITKYQPALQTAGNNVARFDHNPTTGESLGLLIEEQRTNLSTYSEDVVNWYTSKAYSTLKSNVDIAPDGTLTADKVIKDNANANSYVGKNFTTTTNTQYVASVYVKKYQSSSTLKYFALTRTSNTANTAWFDLDTGTVGTVVGTNASATITHVGNDWYRVSYTWEEPTTFITVYHRISTADNTTASTGNGYDGYLVWGFQLEEGSFPTSYIKTTGSQVTRSKDLPKMENINQDNWFKQGKGTWFTNAKTFTPNNNDDKRIIHVDSTSNGSNRFPDIYIENNDVKALFIKQGLTLIANNFVSSDTYFKYSLAYEYQNANVAGDGTAETANTTLTGSASDLTTIYIGSYNASNYFLNGYIKKLTYYPLRLTDNEIVDLTEE